MENVLLNIKDLCTKVEEKEILKGLNLTMKKGEVHVVMGPNGAGKSTLASTIVGNNVYEITSGEIYFENELINDLEAYERARKGIFLSFQIPEEIPGLSIEEFIHCAKESITGQKISISSFKKELYDMMNILKMDKSYAKRGVNVGFSGGEKKKNEILQLAMLNPKLAILDETDSGLDIDATKIVFEAMSKIKTNDMGILIITHHNKVLEYIKPNFVHVLINGKIVKTGDMSLVEEIEKYGYDKIKEEM